LVVFDTLKNIIAPPYRGMTERPFPLPARPRACSIVPMFLQSLVMACA